jgi:hypothetical protein
MDVGRAMNAPSTVTWGDGATVPDTMEYHGIPTGETYGSENGIFFSEKAIKERVNGKLMYLGAHYLPQLQTRPH